MGSDHDRVIFKGEFHQLNRWGEQMENYWIQLVGWTEMASGAESSRSLREIFCGTDTFEHHKQL